VVGILGARQVGKTTLAQQLAAGFDGPVHTFDLEDPTDLARLADPMLALRDLRGFVVLDEVQRRPELFPVLRVLADRAGQPARFLVLGSASPELLRQTSESLAGRIYYHELGGFDLGEVGAAARERLWLRGGFPRSFLAATDGDSAEWRRGFVRTFLERDLPGLGIGVPPETLRRFWTMIAHYHGQVWNGAELARAFGERIATRFGLPVFLYANAATRPERVKLADVRRGQYEGLRTEIDQLGRGPDFGPARMHPSAGAVAVGARPFLIAYNINLDSADVELARRIARRVRESGGGLPRVQANGFWIEELGRAQVSMNLLDFATTPLWLVWETVRELAAEDGVRLAESELIGLAPLAAFLAVADRADAPTEDPVERRLAASAAYLKLRDFSPMQALELRLEAARSGGPTR